MRQRIRRWLRRHRAFLIGVGSVIDLSGQRTYRAMRRRSTADDVRRVHDDMQATFRRMREAQTCEPPHHYMRGAPPGDCVCGQTRMDRA